LWWHIKAAFGSPFALLSVVFGSVAAFHHTVSVFDLSVSPRIQWLLDAYRRLAHDGLDALANIVAPFTGWEFHIPAGLHDWIVLWVATGSVTRRLFRAACRVEEQFQNYMYPTYPPNGWVLRTLMQWHQSFFFFDNPPPSWIVAGLVRLTAWIAIFLIWPVILVEVVLYEPAQEDTKDAVRIRAVQVSYLLILLLQLSAAVALNIVMAFVNNNLSF